MGWLDQSSFLAHKDLVKVRALAVNSVNTVLVPAVLGVWGASISRGLGEEWGSENIPWNWSREELWEKTKMKTYFYLRETVTLRKQIISQVRLLFSVLFFS